MCYVEVLAAGWVGWGLVGGWFRNPKSEMVSAAVTFLCCFFVGPENDEKW